VGQAALLDWVDMQVRLVRGRPEHAFGGIQLIFAGDFFQLGAVNYKKVSLYHSEQVFECDNLGSEVPKHAGGVQLPIAVEQFSAPAFKSNVWREACFTYVKLDKMCAALLPLPTPSHRTDVCSVQLPAE
jgi:hypothetical protein